MIPTYSQISRPVAWLLFAFTLLLALWTFVAVGLFSMLLAPLLRLMVPGEHPVRFDRVVCLAAAVLLPGLFLAWFYLVVAMKSPSLRPLGLWLVRFNGLS
jgi:hypothetical protein